jgi:hypothetical protein
VLSRTYYFHYRTGSSPVSIAFSVDEATGMVLWDAAFCSDKDLFTKSFGRWVAQQRLEKAISKSIYNYFMANNPINIREIRWKIVELLPNHPNCPQSFKD